MGPGSGVGAGPGPGPGLSPAVRGGLWWGVKIIPCEDRSEEAEVFLVAIEGQHVAVVVGGLVILVWVTLALHDFRGWAKEWWHPVAVLISVKEGEVEGLSPAEAQGLRINKCTYMVNLQMNWFYIPFKLNVTFNFTGRNNTVCLQCGDSPRERKDLFGKFPEQGGLGGVGEHQHNVDVARPEFDQVAGVRDVCQLCHFHKVLLWRSAA